MFSVIGTPWLVSYELSTANKMFSPTTVMHTVPTVLPPFPSEAVYSKQSSAVASSGRLSNAPFGLYSTVPFGYTNNSAPDGRPTDPPSVGIGSSPILVTVNGSLSGSLSLSNTFKLVGVPASAVPVSSSTTGASLSP